MFGGGAENTDTWEWDGTDSVTVTANTTPVCSAGTDRITNLGTPVSLSATASDPDGDPVQSRWTLLGGPGGSVLTGVSTLTPTFTPATAGVHLLELAVTDRHGETGRSQVRVTGITVRFSPPVAGSYTFQLAAQDGRGGAASSEERKPGRGARFGAGRDALRALASGSDATR
ncbi:MAG: PKD domain-containing protein [Candidatus Riflebacteria bacterium]|nr:PKD domain-containing protein [Candidatus Riflebacteria bacterium]